MTTSVVKPSFEIVNDKSFESDKKIVFIARHCHLEVVNALRRVILAEVVTVAPRYDQYNAEDPSKNDIFIKENTTVLHDQIMGHRLSLIPIHLSSSAIKKHNRDDYRFLLEAKNETNVPVYATTGEVVIYDSDKSPLNKGRRDSLLPPDPITGDYPIIARLKPGEVFKVEFYARRGVGIEHARFSPVSTCAFMNVVDEIEAEADLAKALTEVPTGDEAKLQEIRDNHATLKKFRFFKKDSRGDPCETRFLVESECGMSAAEIVIEAFDVLIRKIQSMDSPEIFRLVKESPDKSRFVQESLDKSEDKSEDKSQESDKSQEPKMYEFELLGEDHTMGNMYQALCYRFYDKNVLSYIGYHMPHPLERKIVFKIKLKSGENIDSFLSKSRIDAISHLEKIKSLFAEETGLV